MGAEPCVESEFVCHEMIELLIRRWKAQVYKG